MQLGDSDDNVWRKRAAHETEKTPEQQPLELFYGWGGGDENHTDYRGRSTILKNLLGALLIIRSITGVNSEKWTRGNPVRCQFDGLVSIETWNAANRGKQAIVEGGEDVRIGERKVPEYLKNKGARNSDFPFKRIIMCPKCRKPL